MQNIITAAVITDADGDSVKVTKVETGDGFGKRFTDIPQDDSPTPIVYASDPLWTLTIASDGAVTADVTRKAATIPQGTTMNVKVARAGYTDGKNASGAADLTPKGWVNVYVKVYGTYVNTDPTAEQDTVVFDAPGGTV